MLYHGRICPLQTLALDLTKKVYGARSYHGLTAEQVLAGLIFYDEKMAWGAFYSRQKTRDSHQIFFTRILHHERVFYYDKVVIS